MKAEARCRDGKCVDIEINGKRYVVGGVYDLRTDDFNEWLRERVEDAYERGYKDAKEGR